MLRLKYPTALDWLGVKWDKMLNGTLYWHIYCFKNNKKQMFIGHIQKFIVIFVLWNIDMTGFFVNYYWLDLLMIIYSRLSTQHHLEKEKLSWHIWNDKCNVRETQVLWFLPTKIEGKKIFECEKRKVSIRVLEKSVKSYNAG